MSVRSVFEYDLPSVEQVSGVSRAAFDDTIRTAGRPVILKNVVSDWPAVQAGHHSLDALAGYIKGFDVGASTPTFIARPEIKGRYFYTPDMTAFTFDQREVPLRATIDQLIAQKDSDAPIGIYAGASPTVNTLPKFGDDNRMPLLDPSVIAKVWISNSAQIAPHFDISENIACLVSGKRRFVIFPPEEIANLYVGPIDYNMAGQPASMVNLDAIDFDRFPQFHDALKSAQIAELEPGDAIYLPSLWWHFVESQGPFNVLVNYWWDGLKHGSPMNVLALALLVLRDLPANDRAAWQTVFRHYIFDEHAAEAMDHIPEQFRGVLGSKSAERDHRIKTFLRTQLGAVLR
ncbi:MAG: cupin-like domain-containing protein [Pseudomonadota bacterium]